MKYFFLALVWMLSLGCNSQDKSTKPLASVDVIETKGFPQIGEYVTSVYEDKNGCLWFGTLENGIARYDGKSLKYFSEKDGLPSNRVTSVTEDKDGIFWFSTGEGLSKYDGENFTNFRMKDDFSSNMISNFYIDSKNTFWVGTWAGVYIFDGNNFTPFPLPIPEIQTPINKDTVGWITEIQEDSKGNIWFARDAYGLCMYDGEKFTHLLKKDGLNSNSVTEIEVDNLGNIWIGARIAEKDFPEMKNHKGKGGINMLSKNTIHSFPEIKGFNYDNVYGISKDNSGNIYIATSKNGVYKFDGNEFSHYEVPISVMGIKKDSKGNLWFAGAGGLYKVNLAGALINITRDGPWG